MREKTTLEQRAREIVESYIERGVPQWILDELIKAVLAFRAEGVTEQRERDAGICTTLISIRARNEQIRSYEKCAQAIHASKENEG